MKKMIVTALLIALGLGLPAVAVPTIKMNGANGAAYQATILADEGFAGYAKGTTISTFCLEASEYFYPGSSYNAVLNSNNAAVSGGLDWVNGIIGSSRYSVSADPINERTAYLFTMFSQGNNSFQNQGMLQQAIHYIEAENTTSNNYVTLANQAVLSGSWSGLGNVRVMNLWDTNGYRAQDQLIMLNSNPTPPAVVPAPGAVVLGSIGMMFVGYLRRRNTL